MKFTQTHALKIILPLVAVAFAATVSAAQEKSAPQPAASPSAQVKHGPQRIEKEGVEVEFVIEPVAGEGAAREVLEAAEAVVRFRVADKTTGNPVSGMKPAAWMSQRGASAPDTQMCREKIQSFMSGTLRARPDVDLNAYYVLALNQEPNISVIDPLLGFGTSKLLALVRLGSPGADWALTDNGERLFVSMPLANQVAVVDTNTWKVVTNIDAGARPSRVRLQPDGKYLWVGNDPPAGGGEGGVAVIDTASLKVVGRIAVGPGAHDLAISGNNKLAFVTSRDGGTLSVIDIPTLAKVKDLKVGLSAAAVAFSPLSHALYVVDEAGGEIVAVDAREPRILTRIQVGKGARGVRFAPGGRWGFVPNPQASVVYIFDASTNRLAHTAAVGQGPDQIAFTDAFAYVRSAGSKEIEMIRLSTVGKELDVVKFPGGQRTPGEATAPGSLADAIVPAPEGNSVLVANTADRVIYYYSEGMAAPMGNLQNYRRDPRAVMVVDRSLREVKPGVYQTTIKLPASGIYDVPFLLDSPRIAHCFEAGAKPNPAVKRDTEVALRIEYLNKERELRVGASYRLRFRLVETATGKPKDGLKDVQVLLFLGPGVWQWRDFAQPVGAGTYELDLEVPESGLYTVFVESRSMGVAYRQLEHLTLWAKDADASKR
ncbi:MAG TPA: YncE family protein [Pyrinomonadaceae bacterium]